MVNTSAALPLSVSREYEECCPNGNAFGGQWVVRDAAGHYVDHDQYRHDLGPRILRNYGQELEFKDDAQSSLSTLFP